MKAYSPGCRSSRSRCRTSLWGYNRSLSSSLNRVLSGSAIRRLEAYRGDSNAEHLVAKVPPCTLSIHRSWSETAYRICYESISGCLSSYPKEFQHEGSPQGNR